MLKETPINLRKAIIIGLGDAGEITINKLEALLNDRLGGIGVIGLVTIKPNFASSANEISFTEKAGRRWDVLLPMGGDVNASDTEPAEPLSLGSQVISDDKPDTGVLDTKSDPIQLRRNGRQAVGRWGDRLDWILNTVQGHIGTQDQITDVQERGTYDARVDETGLEVFIVAALDEPFASGAFLDLAYLINYNLSLVGGGRFHFHTSGLLYLPNYQLKDTDPAYGKNNTHPAYNALLEGVSPPYREADTYAALKELDYYTSRWNYSSDFRTRHNFSVNGPPFNRSCFLVETTNEESRKLPTFDQLSAMSAEWLYRYLTSPLMNALRSHGSDYARRVSDQRVTAYSGLGIASYILPIDETIDVLGVRMGEEIVRHHIQREARGEEQAQPLGRAQTYAGNPIDQWLKDALSGSEGARRFGDVNPKSYDNINLWDYDGLRKRLLGQCSQRMNQALPSIRRDLEQRAMTALEQVRNHLPGEVRRIIDGNPDGGLDRCQIFLERLRDALAEREQTTKKQASEAHNAEKTAGTAIARARAEYQAACQMATPQAIAGIVLASIVLVGLILYAANIFFQLLPELELAGRNRLLLNFHHFNTVAGIVLILGQIAITAVVIITTYNWMTSTKHIYIARHRERLQFTLRKAIENLYARFYTELQKVVNQEIINLTQFRDLMDNLAEALGEDRRKPRRLFGQLRFPLEESVITTRDLGEFYKEIINPGSGEGAAALQTGSGLDDFVLKLMRTHGPLHSWATLDVGSLKTRIVNFGKSQMEALRRRKSAEQMLIAQLTGPESPDYVRIDVQIMFAASAGEEEQSMLAIPQLPSDKREALRERAQELYTRSLPFLRYDKTQIQSGVEDRPTRLLGTHTAHAEATPLNRITAEFYETTVQRVATQDPHALVAMSVRHGLPLYSLGMARRYRNQYQRFFRSKLLHTRHAHLALPDLFPLPPEVLEPQMAVAMGLAVTHKGKREPVIQFSEEKGYFYVHQERHTTSEIPLGQDKLDACIHLQHNEKDLRRVSTQIDESVVDQAQRLKGGNQAVIRKLNRYIKANEKELKNWEIERIEEHIDILT